MIIVSTGDERDHINVITFFADTQEFVFFLQKKYAIEGETYAPVGGYIEVGESGFDACRRESREEVRLYAY